MYLRVERDEENKATQHANKIGLLHVKLNIQGRRGWPDRVYLPHGGIPFFIEYKRPGQNPEPIQEYIHGQLRQRGYRVHVCTTAAAAIAVMDAASVPTQGR